MKKHVLSFFLLLLLSLSRAGASSHVFWSSEPALPGDTVMLAGDDLQSVTKISIGRLNDKPVTKGKKSDGIEEWKTVKPLQITPRSLKFVVPPQWEKGVFRCEIIGDGWEQSLELNDAEVWWMQGDGGAFATPGGTLRVFGKLLNLGTPAEAILKAENGAQVALKATPGDGYSLSFALPATLPPGHYRVLVSNGPSLPYDTGTLEVKVAAPWPAQIFNVMDFYGAEAENEIRRTLDKGSPTPDRTEAIKAALKKAEANGGGIVFFPEGKYAVQGEIQVPPHTVLRGESMGQTVLRWGKGGFALDGGNDARRLENEDATPPNLMSGGAFGIEDMSLYLPREFQTAITGGDGFAMQRVRIRVDRYWIRSGQRENETTLRVGNNCRITDCDILAQGVAITFNGGQGEVIARNKIMAGKSNIAIEHCDGAIVEDNEFISLDPTAYINLSNEGRNLYYARNRHSSFFVHQSDFSFTFDGQGSAYLGKIAAVNGSEITLAQDPKYPDRAKETHSLWRRSVVCVMDGKGTGQYRFVTANAGRKWTLDRPFDVAPDGTSTISIFPFRGRALIVGNRFEDASWVNMGYGSSLDVICAKNELYRCGYLLNYGLREPAGVHASWFVQYLDNQVHEGHTQVETTSDKRHPELFAGTVTRYCVNRRTHLYADNSGSFHIGGAASDVIVEHCLLDNARSEMKVDPETSGVLLRENTFGNGVARYSGGGLTSATILPNRP